MYTQFKCSKKFGMYSCVITPSEPSSTPSGADGRVRINRLPVSHKESSASSAKLEYADKEQLVPANSTRYMIDFTSHQAHHPLQ